MNNHQLSSSMTEAECQRMLTAWTPWVCVSWLGAAGSRNRLHQDRMIPAYQLWLAEDVVRSDPAPNDMRLTRAPLKTVLERGPTIRPTSSPRHPAIPERSSRVNPAEDPANLQVVDHSRDCREKATLLFISKFHKIPGECRFPRVRWTHSFEGSSMAASR